MGRRSLLLGWYLGAVYLLVALLPMGCAYRSDRTAVTSPHDVKVSERFRGRWWSYYARGRAYQATGDFDAAIRDFQTAVDLRRRDQLWPRTYGMHFLPEYFPHRELGVTRFLQGDIGPSIAELEISLAQQYSARAAYYYGQAQASRLASDGTDSAAPKIEISTATTTLNATSTMLSGIARDDTFVSSIMINDKPFDVRLAAPEVPFEMAVSLLPGDNVVEIVVQDLSGRETTERLVLSNDLDGPSISFDQPVSLPGVVTGVVLDPSGIELLEIGGKAATLEASGGDLFAFTVIIDTTASSAIAFDCVDKLGNRTMGSVPGTGAGAVSRQAVRVALNSEAFASNVFALHAQQLGALSATDGVRVRFEDLEEGKRFYQDEVVVNLKVDSAGVPLEQLTLSSDPSSVLGGDPVPLIADRVSQFVTRRISLREARGDIELVAEVQGQDGTIARDSRRVVRDLNALEVVENRLAIALVPKAEDKSLGDASLTAVVLDELQNNKRLHERFEIVSRDDLEEILRELELSELLAAVERKLSQGEFIPLEVLFTLDVKVVQGNVEIVVEATGAETGAHVLFPRIEVSGPEEKGVELVESLTLRILQEFPRVPGTVKLWRDPSLKCTLTKDQGAHRNRKCLVFRLESDGTSEEQYPVILGEGLIDGVSRRYTSVKVLKSTNDISVGDLPIEKGHYVVLK